MSVDLVTRLIEAGTPAALVAEVAMALAKASAAQEIVETRRAKDRARKSIPRNSTESEESAEFQETPALSPSFPPDPQSNPIPTPVSISRPRKGTQFPAPEGVTAEQWQAFVAQRKKKLTDHAYHLLCGKLRSLAEHGWPPGQMIDLAIERGWETVFEPKDFKNGSPEFRRVGSQGHRNNDGFSAVLREVAGH